MNKEDVGDMSDDDLEKILISFWQEILDVPDVGLHDHFLDLGGDSIQAIRLVNLLQEMCGQVFSPTALFRAPTVSELAEYLKTHHPECVHLLLRRKGRPIPPDITRND